MKSIHAVDEHARIEDIETLTKVYRRVLDIYFGQ